MSGNGTKRGRTVREVLDWNEQEAYVIDTTIDHWKKAIALIFSKPFDATFGDIDRLDERSRSMPPLTEDLFGTPQLLLFNVHGVKIACHFFTVAEIEFDFVPDIVTEESLIDLLAFMIELGDALEKDVILTPENLQEEPIFRYDARARELVWIPPSNRPRA